ncbi:MAG TPA: hypothetical protein VI136_21810 [Verrucomicrobiae bacterium]
MRCAPLDYSIEFSLDGVGWGLGLLTDIWKPGWSYQSEADDYVARYWVDGGARYVRIKAAGDGVAQIDALVAYIPEPGVTTLLILGSLVIVVGKKERS